MTDSKFYEEGGHPSGALFTLDHAKQGLAIDGPISEKDEPFVYIPQKPSVAKNLSSLSKYGKTQFILDYNLAPSLKLNKYQTMLEEWIEEYFDPKLDWIALTGGDPVTPMLFGIVFQRVLPGAYIRYLRWNRESHFDVQGNKITKGEYVPTGKLHLRDPLVLTSNG